jgi:hypothetical protein
VPEYRLEPVPAPALRPAGEDAAAWVRPTGRALEFRTVGQVTDVTLTPLCRLYDERYAVYWRVSRTG